MRASQTTTVVTSVVLVACLVSSVLLLRRIDQARSGSTLEEVLYISSPKMLKRMSLGYDGLLADIYWTRAVQYFGDKHHAGAQDYRLLAPLLDITTTLDPKLIVAYQYGGNFLAPKPPNGAGMPQATIELIEKGIRSNPDNWNLYYQLGFTYYMELSDYEHAAEAFSRGATLPNAHPFLKLLAAQMAERSGDLRTARMLWVTTFESTSDKAIKANAAAHLRALQVDEDVTVLAELADRYRQATGHFPSSFAEMEAAKLIRGTPKDPLGNPYKLVAGGRVELASPDDFPFVQKGTPPGYTPPVAPKILPTD
jgi:tetratricopeptide (TPR) repeat protein